MTPGSRTSLPLARRVALTALLALLLTACDLVETTPPAPTPADFPGIATELGQRGIRAAQVRSGDAGCDDPSLAPTAISMTLEGLDQSDPVPVYLYIFRNREAFERRRTDVDACARSYVTDPGTFASIEASPFVLAGQGPWAPGFAAELRAGITEAAGTGG
ncbi:MAG TPA: hypothetical protein VM344_05940 [Vitreimonas sp.]|nr:hypothetical protein [Vitreimonas sp.]